MSAVQVVSGIIEDDQGRVLLAQRPPGKKLAGMWEFPGGKIDAGESPEQALNRELKEELQLDVRIVKSLGVFPYIYDWGAIDLHVFVVRALGEPKTTEDVHVFKWLKALAIARDQLAPADLKPLDSYLTSRP
jgi:8-oxo-dGTP diphosphatase